MTSRSKARRIQAGDFRSSGLSTDRCYTYVFPCSYEDILKLGFSRDPLRRLHALHRRWFAFFDLDRAFLVETETVRDARQLELELGKQIVLHGAPSPLVIRRQAAGHTEWYRGAYAALAASAEALRSKGFVLHLPATDWLRSALVARSDRLYSGTERLLQAIEWALHADEPADAMEAILRDTLDAYDALAIDVEPMLAPAVHAWHRSQRR